MSKKPIYTLSASMLNNIKWINQQKTKKYKENALEQLRQAVKKIYTENEHTIRGKAFEKEFMEGKHPEFNIDPNKMEQQTWVNKYIEYADFTIKLVGKLDLYDPKENYIYEVKRTLRYFDGKYGDSNTIQHDLYLYMLPEAKGFEYKIAHGEENEILGYKSIKVERKENLDQYIKQHIEEFLQFIHRESLLELYLKNYKVNF